MLLAFAGLSEVLRKHTYVGMADETLALLQHGTRLYLFNLASLSKDMFYQQVLAANAEEYLQPARPAAVVMFHRLTGLRLKCWVNTDAYICIGAQR